MDDIFALQDRVTSSVVATIAPRLEQAEIDRSERKPTESLGALDLYYRALHHYRDNRSATHQRNEDTLHLALQAISLDANFAAVYGLITALYSERSEQRWTALAEIAAEGKKYALRAAELGADDAFALSRAAHFFGAILKDARTADELVDQAIALNPNLADAWRIRGWISVFLGKHEPALDQFKHAMRLNPLDFRNLITSEAGLAAANFCLHRFEIALSWATKSLSRYENYAVALRCATASCAMLGRVADVQTMLARMREAGVLMTITQLERYLPFRREDVDLYIEAFRLAGVPE